MKNILFFIAVIIALTACNQNNGTKSLMAKVDQVRFPPPVAKPDNEVSENETDDYNAAASVKTTPQNIVLTPPPDQNVNKQIPDATKKIVKEGNISFEH